MRPPITRVSGLLPAFVFVLFAVACRDIVGPEAGDRDPIGIVLVIGDGMGDGAIDAARLSRGSLSIEELGLRSHVITSSATDSVTDSGAAATALATGVLTYNRAIGVGLDSMVLRSVLEIAEENGLATGLVATSSVTHATPAAFVAHVPDRSLQFEIADQISRSGVEVLLGGGQHFFDPEQRPDGTDPLERFRHRECTVTFTASELNSVSEETPCVVGLFDRAGMAAAAERQPTLREMTDLAVSILTRDDDGFFLMIEGSQIDWAEHDNDGPRTVQEVLDLDDAVASLVLALSSRRNTLLLVTADHETGGLSVETGSDGSLRYAWTTTGHTSSPVPLFGAGLGTERLSEVSTIDEIGRFIINGLTESLP